MNVNQMNAYLFNRLIHATHYLSETKLKNRLGKPLLRFLGWSTLKIKNGKQKGDIKSAAKEWQRMFPSNKMVPIVSEQAEMVIAEIHSECPYRGSGNLDGCYRMMEYDRRMVEHIGGEFTVLESQASVGNSKCVVAISTKTQREKLIDAHLID